MRCVCTKAMRPVREAVECDGPSVDRDDRPRGDRAPGSLATMRSDRSGLRGCDGIDPFHRDGIPSLRSKRDRRDGRNSMRSKCVRRDGRPLTQPPRARRRRCGSPRRSEVAPAEFLSVVGSSTGPSGHRNQACHGCHGGVHPCGEHEQLRASQRGSALRRRVISPPVSAAP